MISSCAAAAKQTEHSETTEQGYGWFRNDGQGACAQETGNSEERVKLASVISTSTDALGIIAMDNTQ